MNFAITGKKIVSSQPEKKIVICDLPKGKDIKKPIIKPVQKKISVPPQLAKKEIKVQKEVKKQQPKVQIKKQEIILPPPVQTKVEQIPVIQQVKPQPKRFDILVRYNHYKDKFPTQNNILRYQFIQNKYNFADVFKGNYQPRLQIYRNYSACVQPLTRGTALDFTWQVEEGKQYEITIQEDQQEQSKYQRKAYIAPKQQKKCLMKKNLRAEQLTNQMKNMSIQELGSQKHKMLLEQRALEQDLFS